MRIKLFCLMASVMAMAAPCLSAQTFTTLYSFTDGNDGRFPEAGFVLSGNTLYGTATGGGSSGFGTVFAINTDGTGFTNLYSFTDGTDGDRPQGGLILSGNTLYGTTFFGGASDAGGYIGYGTVFAVNTDGSGFTTLHSFTGGSDGARPYAAVLVLADNTLYGTAAESASTNNGTVFSVNTDGTGFATLYSFTGSSDGGFPIAGLVLSGNTLYGTAAYGGSSGYGTVFAVNTDGTGFTNLYSFTATTGPLYTNSDGSGVSDGLVLSGNILYGTAAEGGNSGYGTVFAVKTDGTGFTALHSFARNDGAYPYAGLVLSGNTLYGTTASGGSFGNGTVFALNTDGTEFVTLYSFTAETNRNNSDGANPRGGLIVSRNTLYGTAFEGGSADGGTVFSLSLPVVNAPQLTIALSGTNVVLTWPANATGFTLKSTASLLSPAVWTSVSPGAVVVNGQNTVTNPISVTQQFYQLSE